MSEWRDLVRRELDRYRRETGTAFVDRQEFLAVALPVFESAFPDASTPSQTFSRVMQELRDRDEVEFVDGRGTYRILDLASESATSKASSDDPANSAPSYTASTYETTVGARSMPAAFRGFVLDQYGHRCPVSGVDRTALIDVAHVLPWSDYEDVRTDPENVFALDKTHHAAFDEGYFTLDGEFRLRVAPSFETESDLLRRTLVEQSGTRIERVADRVNPQYLARHNETLDWW